MNKKELAEQILKEKIATLEDADQLLSRFEEWKTYEFSKAVIAAIIEAMGATTDTTKAENELEEQLVENILSEFERIGIDTSEWEGKFGDGNFAHEFIAAGIKDHLEKLENF